MNFFPTTYSQKRAKRVTSFSNPLSGLLYNNQIYESYTGSPQTTTVQRQQKSPHDLPISTNDFENQENLVLQQVFGKKYIRKRPSLSLKNKHKIQRQIVAIRATSKLAQPLNKSSLFYQQCSRCLRSQQKSFSFKRPQQSQSHSDVLPPLTSRTEVIAKGLPIKASESSLQTDSSFHNSKYSFQHVEILILDIVKSHQDLAEKVLRINFEKYFKSFFKKQLSGHFTQQFVDKVEYYLQFLIQKQQLDVKVQKKIFTQQISNFATKFAFMRKLSQLQEKNTIQADQKIDAIIKFYCVPSKQFRESCMRDILQMLSLEVFEKFNCNRQSEYMLIREDGQQITEIMQIKFSTRKLFLTDRRHCQQNFIKYLKIVDDFQNDAKNMTFNQGIKSLFRKKIAKGFYDESYVNYSQCEDILSFKRKRELGKIQKILQMRNDIHRVSKYGNRQHPYWKQQRQQLLLTAKTRRNLKSNKNSKSKSKSKHSPKQRNNSQLLIHNPPRWVRSSNPSSQSLSAFQTRSQSSKLQHLDAQFWKADRAVISPELISPKKTLRKPKSCLQNDIRSTSSQLHNLLSIEKKADSGLVAKTENQFREDFNKLVNKNMLYDSYFNQKHDFDRIMKKCMVNQFNHFQSLSQKRIDRILQAIKLKEVKKKQVLSDKTQQQILCQDSALSKKSLKEQYTNSNHQQQLKQSISWEQYRNLRSVILCIEPKQAMMNFVAKYLQFNEYGELSRDKLTLQIGLILENRDQSTRDVIVGIIWSWLQSNSIIKSNVIRRQMLESWFQKYKIVYFLIISLIFGTKSASALDLAYEILYSSNIEK